MYRFYNTSSSARKVYADEAEWLQVQNLEASRIHAIWIFYHDTHRIEHVTAYDEGKVSRSLFCNFLIRLPIFLPDQLRCRKRE